MLHFLNNSLLYSLYIDQIRIWTDNSLPPIISELCIFQMYSDWALSVPFLTKDNKPNTKKVEIRLWQNLLKCKCLLLASWVYTHNFNTVT